MSSAARSRGPSATMFPVKQAEPPAGAPTWLAVRIPYVVAALLELDQVERWPELELYGIEQMGRGASVLFQAAPATMARVLERLHYLRGWKREGRHVLPRTDRIQVDRAIGRVTEAVDRHTKRELHTCQDSR